MKIVINKEEIETNSTSLNSILEERFFSDKKGIAVALNNSVIPKTDWETTIIKQNDNILIITATQGG